ncbi:MAG: hypothetical protein AB1545_10880 [Thermodesulfobacteriota bacterium]
MQKLPKQIVKRKTKGCDGRLLRGRGKFYFEITRKAKSRSDPFKDLAQIEAKRGGQVFDCVHSFSEAGCGLDSNCENCKIKNAVVGTFVTGEANNNVQAVLDIKKTDKTTPYILQVSTQKIGDFALLTIEKYEEKA